MKKFATMFFFVIMSVIIGVTANAASPAAGCSIRTTKNIETQVGVIPQDSRLSVVDESAGGFIADYNGNVVEISFDDCLINVKDFIPSIDCWLDMAQPQNMFSMADEQIPGLTDRQFYHNPGSADGSEAWLRYEACVKLKSAQQEFLADGYSIIIYDAYRPFTCTKEFQAAYRAYLNTKSSAFKNQWFGSLGESWFLAQKASSHNYGVAVDMGLKRVSDGYVLPMPSAIHTLDIRSAFVSWGSVTNSEAADNARYMKSVMEGSGFTYLKSEWWHFQDNSIVRNSVIDIPN